MVFSCASLTDFIFSTMKLNTSLTAFLSTLGNTFKSFANVSWYNHYSVNKLDTFLDSVVYRERFNYLHDLLKHTTSRHRIMYGVTLCETCSFIHRKNKCLIHLMCPVCLKNVKNGFRKTFLMETMLPWHVTIYRYIYLIQPDAFLSVAPFLCFYKMKYFLWDFCISFCISFLSCGITFGL